MIVVLQLDQDNDLIAELELKALLNNSGEVAEITCSLSGQSSAEADSFEGAWVASYTNVDMEMAFIGSAIAVVVLAALVRSIFESIRASDKMGTTSK